MVLIKNNAESKKQTKISYFRINIIDNNDAIFCDCDEDKIASHFCKNCSSEDHTEFLFQFCVDAIKQ